MRHATWCKLGLACCTTLASVALLAVPAPAQLLGGEGGVQLPDVNEVPGVKDLGDTVENATGVDLPNLGSSPSGSQPLPEPSAESQSPAPAPAPSLPPQSAPPAVAPGPQPAAAAPGGPGATPAGERGGGAQGVEAGGSGAGGGGGDAGGGNRSASGRDDARDAEPESAGTESDSGLGGFLTDVEELPWGLFAAIIAFAALGLAMAGRSALLARLARRLHLQGDELREDVGALQAALLPEVPDRIGDVGVSVAYRPKDGPAAGGDFHDVMALDDGRIAVVIGDVSGHGREALTITALAHYTVRAYLEAGLEPREALRLAEEALGGKLGEDFVTVLAAVYNPHESSLVYATAGHPAPILTGPERPDAVHLLTPPPIGVGPRTGFRQTTTSVPEGAEICLFTDGLVEARLAGAALLDRDGLGRILRAPEVDDAQRVLDRVAAEATVVDDMTACVLRPLSARGDGSIAEEIDLHGTPTVCDRLEPFCASFGMEPSDRAAAIAECRRAALASHSARLRLRRDESGAIQWATVIAGEGAGKLAAGPAPAGIAG